MNNASHPPLVLRYFKKLHGLHAELEKFIDQKITIHTKET